MPEVTGYFSRPCVADHADAAVVLGGIPLFSGLAGRPRKSAAHRRPRSNALAAMSSSVVVERGTFAIRKAQEARKGALHSVANDRSAAALCGVAGAQAPADPGLSLPARRQSVSSSCWLFDADAGVSYRLSGPHLGGFRT